MGRLYAEVIGDPITHSKSPMIHNFWLEKLGIDAEYRACHVRPDELADYFARKREDPEWRGCNVTMPHKHAVGGHLDSILGPAQKVGAVNCVYVCPTDGHFVGENSDVDGVLECIVALCFQRPSCITCLLGTGGASRAALHALTISSATEVRIVARDLERAKALLDEFGMIGFVSNFDDLSAALTGIDTLINATSLGMKGQPKMPDPVIDGLAGLRDDAIVFDMVYSPVETALVVAARRAGLNAIDGLTMLLGQADLAFALFFGAPPPRQHDAELRMLLTGQ